MPELPVGIVTRFEVQTVLRQKNDNELVNLSAVISTDAKPENRVFSKFTPSGSIAIAISQEGAVGLFEPGDEYEVIFRKIPNRAQA